MSKYTYYHYDNYNYNYDPPPKRHKKRSRRRHTPFSRLLKFSLVIFIFWWFNNYTLKTTKETIVSQKVSNEINIAVISDFHAYDGFFSIKKEKVVKRIEKLNPDIVCVLGDMHSMNSNESEKQMSMDLMTDIINDGYKLFFVLGEHDDRTNEYISKMEENGIDVLDGECQKFAVKNTVINIYGISNAYFSPEFDLNNQFDINKEDFNILMAHIPMYSDYEKFGADLTLCGDTHGGIIQIPFLGPIYHNGEFFPELSTEKSKIYDKGLFEYNGGHMFITSGIGNHVKNKNTPVRLFNRPEVALITIKPK